MNEKGEYWTGTNWSYSKHVARQYHSVLEAKMWEKNACSRTSCEVFIRAA